MCHWPPSDKSTVSASTASSFHSPSIEMAVDFSRTDSCQHFITAAAGASWFLPGNQVSLLANPCPLHTTRPIPGYLKFRAPFLSKDKRELAPEIRNKTDKRFLGLDFFNILKPDYVRFSCIQWLEEYGKKNYIFVLHSLWIFEIIPIYNISYAGMAVYSKVTFRPGN